MEIKNRIRLLIRELGIKNIDFANRISISTGNLSDWLYGKSLPNSKALTRICEVYNVNINWLFSGKGGMFTDKDIGKQFKELNETLEKNNIELVREIQDLKDKLYSKTEKIERLQDELLQEKKNKYGGKR